MERGPDRIVIERILTQQDFDRFAALSGDDNPIHVDPEFSARTRFGRTVSHGVLLYSILRGLIARLVPGARQISQRVMFPSPTYADETIRFEAEVRVRDDTTTTVQVRATRVEDGQVTCEGETTLSVPESGTPHR